MKRFLVVILLFAVSVPALTTAAPKKKKKKKGPCAVSLVKCPVTGCGGSIDKNLNRHKNIKTAPTGPADDMTIAEIKALEDPVSGFKKGDKRDALTALGEGKLIRVVAQALVV